MWNTVIGVFVLSHCSFSRKLLSRLRRRGRLKASSSVTAESSNSRHTVVTRSDETIIKVKF